MPNLHDVERRIHSVNSTKQITRTMEMVAAAKIRRSSERVEEATPYSNSMSEMLASVAGQSGGGESALLKKHDDIKRVLVVVVVSDRGLAGGFNSNVLRESERLIKERRQNGAEVDVIACGKKALGYFKYRKITPVMEFVDLSADPTPEQASAIAAYAIAGYENETLDEVVLVYNQAKNAAEQVLCVEPVLLLIPPHLRNPRMPRKRKRTEPSTRASNSNRAPRMFLTSCCQHTCARRSITRSLIPRQPSKPRVAQP